MDRQTGMTCNVPWKNLPWAYGYPGATARWRVVPEDFLVEEVLGCEPAGQGQHVLVQVRKRGTNTPWVAREVARLAGVASSAVGYSGLKDRHAGPTQWLSVDLAGRSEPDGSSLGAEGVEVLGCSPRGSPPGPGIGRFRATR